MTTIEIGSQRRRRGTVVTRSRSHTSSEPVRRTPVDTAALNNPQLSDVLTTWDADLLDTTWTTWDTDAGDAGLVSRSSPQGAGPVEGDASGDVVIQVDWIDAAQRPQTSIARTSSADCRWTPMPLTAWLVGEGARASLRITRMLSAEQVRQLEHHGLSYADGFVLQGSLGRQTKTFADFDVDVIAKFAALSRSTESSEVFKAAMVNAHQAIVAALTTAFDKSQEQGIDLRLTSPRQDAESAAPDVPDELTGEAADVIAAVEWLQRTLGVPRRDILKAAKIRERTWHHWQKTPAAHPRLSSQGQLWAIMQQVQILLEELDELPATWFRRNTGLRKLLQKGKFDEIVDSVIEEKARAGAFDDPTTSRRRAAAGPEYYLDDLEAGDGSGGDDGGRRR